MVLCAPDERWLRRLLTRMDRELFRSATATPLPLERRTVEWNIGEFGGECGEADA
jgi:hypothetical protein